MELRLEQFHLGTSRLTPTNGRSLRTRCNGYRGRGCSWAVSRLIPRLLCKQPVLLSLLESWTLGFGLPEESYRMCILPVPTLLCWFVHAKLALVQGHHAAWAHTSASLQSSVLVFGPQSLSCRWHHPEHTISYDTCVLSKYIQLMEGPACPWWQSQLGATYVSKIQTNDAPGVSRRGHVAPF